VWEIIEGLKTRDQSLLLTTHYMEEAAQLCDRVVIVDRGKIIAQGHPADLVRSLGGHPLIELEPSCALPEQTFGQVPGLVGVRERGGRLHLEVRQLHQAVPAVFETLQRSGASAVSFSTRERTLDDVFLNLTGRQLREG
jgi:ABC-2 type transport system ATP-binding protein